MTAGQLPAAGGRRGRAASPAVDSIPAETSQRYRRLRALNLLAGVLLAVEALAWLIFANVLRT